jgi:hypothetical protein
VGTYLVSVRVPLAFVNTTDGTAGFGAQLEFKVNGSIVPGTSIQKTQTGVAAAGVITEEFTTSFPIVFTAVTDTLQVLLTNVNTGALPLAVIDQNDEGPSLAAYRVSA